MQKKRAPAQPADPFEHPDIDPDEVADEEATWRDSGPTRKRRADMVAHATKLIRTIVLKAQKPMENSEELALLSGQLQALDGLIVAFGGTSIFAERAK